MQIAMNCIILWSSEHFSDILSELVWCGYGWECEGSVKDLLVIRIEVIVGGGVP